MANKKSEKQKKAAHGKQKRKQNNSSRNQNSSEIIDDRAKHDILGIVFIVLGVALFAVALIPSQAPVTSIIVSAFRFIFGVGIYILPFVFIAIGISFFFHMVRQKVTIRVTIGFCLIFVAILAIISVCAPCVNEMRYEKLFDIDVINNYGGIIGSSIAWLGATLLGALVTIILMVGVILAGAVVLGLSVTKIVTRLKERRDDIDAKRTGKTKSVVAGNQINIEPIKQQNNTSAKKHRFKNPFSRNSPVPQLDANGNVAFDSAGNPIDATFESNVDFEPNQIRTRRLGDDSSLQNNDSLASENTPCLNNNNSQAKNIEPIDNSKTQILNKNQSRPDKNEFKTDDNKSKKTAVITKPKKEKKTIQISDNPVMPTPTPDFVLPSPDILKDPTSTQKVKQSDSDLRKIADRLARTLCDFNISAKVVGWVAGPTVTLFKVDLPAGIRVSRITALNDDIALALAAPGVRVFAPIPGTTYVGIEVPNAKRQTVLLSEVLSTAKQGPLQIAIGKDVEGNSIVSDLATMPHLLIGGTTGSGKSVSINAMIMSILMRATPDEVRMILIDPKRVEFTPYNGIPHLMVPVVTEPKEAASALSWGVAEMERRLRVFSEVGVRNIGHYNSQVHSGATDENGEELEQLPYIVIVIDELADLMMAIGKEIEYSISRIAQLARAAGIHLIVATQRPSTNVVTGLIKANITNRIAFNVASGIDSRVILDTGGAESLIGLGDLLLTKPELSKPLRIQGCFVEESEISKVVKHLKKQGDPDYDKEILKTNLITIDSASGGDGGNGSGAGSDDDLFWEAAEMVVSAQSGSTSSLQRRFKIGYARAGRIMDMLEEKGIVGPQNGSKPREVLIDHLDLEGLKALDGYDTI